MITATNLYKSISETIILNDVSIRLKKAEINLLFGPSGSGKTTLCRNLALLDFPDKGRIEIDGLNYEFPLKERPKVYPYPKVNFVYQQLFLWPHLTNRQNIFLPINRRGNINRKEIDELTEFLEIDEILDNYPNQSSIGEKQRVAIARALILNPEFIFFDEITSALDIVQTKKIVELVKVLKTKGIGVLLVTHNLGAFKNIADNLFFLQKGSIIEWGKKEILTQPKSTELINFLR